jgi:hypothetical protein
MIGLLAGVVVLVFSLSSFCCSWSSSTVASALVDGVESSSCVSIVRTSEGSIVKRGSLDVHAVASSGCANELQVLPARTAHLLLLPLLPIAAFVGSGCNLLAKIDAAHLVSSLASSLGNVDLAAWFDVAAAATGLLLCSRGAGELTTDDRRRESANERFVDGELGEFDLLRVASIGRHESASLLVDRLDLRRDLPVPNVSGVLKRHTNKQPSPPAL